MKIKIGKHVLDALDKNIPVVALESTIISHGMPYPENYECALSCEKIVYQEGCVPATIGIIDGEIIVGLSNEEIKQLAISGLNVFKTSRRDIPYVVSHKLNGATTVASTMYIANMANIHFMATGGIGGVHQGVSESWDISADLEELSTTDVCVVCAGAKAILDLGKTLEYLETKSVPVIGYQTDYLPAFYSATSEFKVPYRMDSPQEISSFVKTKWDLSISGGVLVTNPIDDKYNLDYEYMKGIISKAISDSKNEGIVGKRVTPYLLNRVKELTGGDSLDSNLQLVFSNCKLASRIARSYFGFED